MHRMCKIDEHSGINAATGIPNRSHQSVRTQAVIE